MFLWKKQLKPIKPGQETTLPNLVGNYLTYVVFVNSHLENPNLFRPFWDPTS